MFELEKLPFEKNSLEPFISEETIDFHYLKHHKWYVDKLNTLIKWTEYENMNLVDIIKNSKWAIFNNAAQVWNHTFYWNCLTWNWQNTPDWNILALIKESFWNFESFKKQFSESAINNFWSAWTWLVLNSDWKLEIINTSNADTPIKDDKNIVLVIDIWEHAYYIDRRNDRASYVEKFWNIVNWDFVNSQIKKEA